MKLIGLLALGAFAMTSMPLTAQNVTRTTVTRTTHVERHNNWGRHRVKRKVCTVRWYNHKKVRRCVWR